LAVARPLARASAAEIAATQPKNENHEMTEERAEDTRSGTEGGDSIGRLSGRMLRVTPND
jgi:hypothetical protein